MRVAMLIVGTVVGLAVVGWFAAALIAAATIDELSERTETMVLALGVTSVAWLFGVAFTWGRPAWARPCYVVAALCAVSAAIYAPRAA
jgi:hypothetical protein